MAPEHFSRRDWLRAGATGMAGALAGPWPGWAQSAAESRAKTLDGNIWVLIELRGGNDGLNTVVPFTDPAYLQLRPAIGLRDDQVLKLDERTGLNVALQALLPLWEKNELAIVQGVGYPSPNLSHFRSVEIWDTASHADEYLREGWAARGLRELSARSPGFTCEGVRMGSSEMGPLTGAKAVTLNDPESFVLQASQAGSMAPGSTHNPALAQLLRVQAQVQGAVAGLQAAQFPFTTVFPAGPFGARLRACAQVLVSQQGRGGVPVVMLTLGSFDTHRNQVALHGNLLRQLAEGFAALKSAFTEIGLWDRTLLMTFSEFGRRARQNQSDGTDHGTAAPLLLAGGAVRGGLYGKAPELGRLDANQNLLHTVDFRQVYSTLARRWWGVNPEAVARGKFDPLDFLRG